MDFQYINPNCTCLLKHLENSIEYCNAKLKYVKSGSGPDVMLLFHGFGQDHNAFKTLLPTLSKDYTCYSFDLFFHGESQWNKGELPLEKEFWMELLEKFLSESKIDKFSMTGFSLGCRFILASIEAFPEKVKKVYLLAPDGVKASFWYTIATYPWTLRMVFKSMIKHPFSFKTLAHSLYELHLADKSLVKFAEHQMNTLEKRRRVYYAWVVFRHLKFNLEKLSQLINKNNIPVTIITGKKDPVIKAKNMDGLIKKLKNCRVEVLDSGHRGILKHQTLSEIIR
jgi:pimeloyl-ACP methyl ester carboxylesterase